MNKKVCIVNHTVDPGNRDIVDIIKVVYLMLDLISVRERLSYNKLIDLNINNVKFIPDSLLSYTPKGGNIVKESIKKEIDFTKPYICIGDSSAILSNYSGVIWDVIRTYKHLVSELKRITPQIVFIDGFNGGNKEINQIIKETGIVGIKLNNCNYHELYHVLSNA